MLKGVWKGKGVYNVEEFDPEPFMEKLNIHGLPWLDTEYRGTL
jgi:saccharopine dehydrogenase (NAD+, L-lysine forming)